MPGWITSGWTFHSCPIPVEGGAMMAYCWSRKLMWVASLLLIASLPVLATAQQATRSDADLVREGASALAAAHGERPRYGGKFVSVGNEEIPLYDMHQTSFGGVYAATAPVSNCLIR